MEMNPLANSLNDYCMEDANGTRSTPSTLCPAINTLQAGSNLINTSPSNLAQSNLVRGLQVDFPKKISDLDFGAPPDLDFEDDCEENFEVNFDDIF